jgi:hypothetical protein
MVKLFDIDRAVQTVILIPFTKPIYPHSPYYYYYRPWICAAVGVIPLMQSAKPMQFSYNHLYKSGTESHIYTVLQDKPHESIDDCHPLHECIVDWHIDLRKVRTMPIEPCIRSYTCLSTFSTSLCLLVLIPHHITPPKTLTNPTPISTNQLKCFTT